MELYKTGNPVPSSAMPDVWDNNRVQDQILNGKELEVELRTGEKVLSWKGVEKQNELSIEKAEIAAEASEVSAGKANSEAQRASNSADRAERVQYIGKPYNDVVAAQAAITAGTETNQYFYIRSDVSGVLIEEYENVSGVATRTYRGMASSQSAIELNQWVGTQVYTSLNNIDDYYIPLRGANIGKQMPIASSQGPNVVTHFPVTPGQTYIIKAADYRADYLAVVLKEDNLLTETTLGLATLSGTGTYRTFTVPKDSTAKFAFMNIVIAFGVFDIRSSLSISVDVIKNIHGIDIYDEFARDYLAELNAQTSGGLYSELNNHDNYYVPASGANAGKLIRNSNVAYTTVVTHFPVFPGITYEIKALNLNAGSLVGCFKDNDLLTGDTLGLISLRPVEGGRIFTVPEDLPARFVFLNVSLPAVNFDIRSNISVAVARIDYLNGVPIYDDYARNHLIDDSVRVIDEAGGQMYDPVNNVPGYYIRATGANAGRIETSEGTALTMFPVVPGTTYTIEASSFNPLYFVLALKTNNLLTGATLGVTPLSGTDGTRSFTVPPDSPAKFAFMNIKLPGANWDITSGLWISGLIKKIVNLKDYGIYDETARKLIAQLSNTISKGSVLTGRSWAVIGDSITEKNFRTTKNYHEFVSENVGGMSVYNYGISGSGYYDRSGVASSVSQTPDYVTVFFGTNDWGQVRNSKPLGAFLDTGTDTISGCINTCLLGVITKFYSKRIAVFTPLPRVTNWGSNASPNVVGYTLEQLATLIKRYAEHYSIPCLDLYHSSNLPVYTTEGNKLYFTAPSLTAPDGLHPNDAGHKMMAAKIQTFLESI